jgi:hypothetical protein
MAKMRAAIRFLLAVAASSLRGPSTRHQAVGGAWHRTILVGHMKLRAGQTDPLPRAMTSDKV